MYDIKGILMTVTTFVTVAVTSCVNTDDLETRLDNLEMKIEALETEIAALNDNAIAISSLLKEKIAIIGMSQTESGYEMELSDGTVIRVTDGIKASGTVPIIGIDENGEWIMSLDNGNTYQPIPSEASPTPEEAATPRLRVNKEGYWEYSMDNGKNWTPVLDENGKAISAVNGKEQSGIKTFFKEIRYSEGDDFATFVLADGRSLSIVVEKSFTFEILGYKEGYSICLNETVKFEVNSSKVKDMAIQVPDGWIAAYDGRILSVTGPAEGKAGLHEIGITAISVQGFIRHISLNIKLNPIDLDVNACEEWNNFIAGNERNVLVDFSYAGYDHGETAPPDCRSLGYSVYDVTDYGAIPNDGISDRQAFLETLKAALGKDYRTEDRSLTFDHKEKANAIIYFPEGEFILHDKDDDLDGMSQSIIIRSGNLIIKGAGREKTILAMNDEMLPERENVLYSSPDMIQIKHNSSFASFPQAAVVTDTAEKGSFSLAVSSSAAMLPGEWVCLHVKNNDPEFVAKELYPYSAESNWKIATEGVEVIEYHCVKAVEGNIVTFTEPILHDVTANAGWEIKTYPHYENVGIEDLTFKGNAKSDFLHHGSWKDDGGYKPVSMNRLVNSWIRRVGFESVSEACSIINSANVSAYDIIMSGNLGHASIRSQASSRILIAATADNTSDNAGNFHGVGVSQQSIGTVLWRNKWGDNSCFESHATQPRATLIDCCSGGWMRGRQGGDADQVPHHLDDLIIWNFTATGQDSDGLTDYAGFTWWESTWWKFLPPVIVGFQSDFEVIFNADQSKKISSQGISANPESLYEAQLRRRLGAVPAWLNTLKQ